MNKPFDPTKPFQTRDGRKARILARDLQAGEYSLAVAVMDDSGHEAVRSFTDEGRYIFGDFGDLDLVNVPEKIVVEGWVNVYPPHCHVTPKIWGSRLQADQKAGELRIACIKVRHEVTEGEGL